MGRKGCNHRELVLLEPKGEKLRCRHCHLTIDAKELAGDGYCPECYEIHGVKRRDFETLRSKEADGVRYGCERCGAVIKA